MNYYNTKLQEGLEYQDFLIKKLYLLGIIIITYSSQTYQNKEGESLTHYEIKFDDRYKETNNLYIQTHERRDIANYFVPSGILRDDNTFFYIIGNYEECYLFTKNSLKTLFNSKHYREVEIHTSKGFLIPKDTAELFAQKIIL